MWFKRLREELEFLGQKTRTETESVWLRFLFSRKGRKDELPSITEAESHLIGRFHKSRFIPLSEKNFRVKAREEWGTARPGNICVHSSGNVEFTGNEIVIHNRFEEGGITGKDWEGKEVTRKFSSGLVESVELFGPAGGFYVIVSLKYAALGAWDGIWLLDKNTPPPVYREIDLLERMSKSPPGSEIQLNVHGDVNNERRQIPVKFDLRTSRKIPETFLVYAIIENGVTEMGINAMPLYRTRFACPAAPMTMIFSSGIHDYGMLPEEDIRSTILRNAMTIHRFAILGDAGESVKREV